MWTDTVPPEAVSTTPPRLKLFDLDAVLLSDESLALGLHDADLLRDSDDDDVPPISKTVT